VFVVAGVAGKLGIFSGSSIGYLDLFGRQLLFVNPNFVRIYFFEQT